VRKDSPALVTISRRTVISGVQAKVSCNEKYDDHDADDVENIHSLLRIEPSEISM
jgi:hypothetical protein